MDPDSFDHHSQEFARDPARHWQALRETCPVAHSDRYGGFYILTRYDDVVAADRDAERFSSADDPFGKGKGGRGVTIPPSPMQFGFIEMDAPDHMQHRRIFSAWFGPRAMAQRKPAIRATTTQVIDRVIARGEADLVLDVVNPTTGMNMCALIGLPPENWQRYMDPFRDAVIVNRAAPEFEQVMEKLDGVKAELRRLMQARRAQPRDDLISHVVHAEIEGKPAVELAPHHINVNAIAPGTTPTDMWKQAMTAKGMRLGMTLDDFSRAADASIPWGRKGTPEDVGNAVVFLASDNAEYITGELLHVSGGQRGPGAMPARTTAVAATSD